MAGGANKKENYDAFRSHPQARTWSGNASDLGQRDYLISSHMDARSLVPRARLEPEKIACDRCVDHGLSCPVGSMTFVTLYINKFFCSHKLKRFFFTKLFAKKFYVFPLEYLWFSRFPLGRNPLRSFIVNRTVYPRLLFSYSKGAPLLLGLLEEWVSIR